MESVMNMALSAALGGMITYVFSMLAFGKQIAAMDSRLKAVETTLASITVVSIREA